MALVGGGGAGNTAGSNPSGTGSSLNYVRTSDGDFAYAYSGIVVDVPDSDTSLLEFTTGSETIDAKVQFNYSGYSTSDYAYSVKINGETIQRYTVRESNPETPDNPLYILIPPYSFVQCQAILLSGSAQDQIVGLTGRVYA